jgi:hypothetical protein
VRCNAGAGTPSEELYVYDGASSADSPHLAQTLLTMTDNWQASTLAVDGASISLPVGGFSGNSVPRCCPDVSTTLVWHWTGAEYQLDNRLRAAGSRSAGNRPSHHVEDPLLADELVDDVERGALRNPFEPIGEESLTVDREPVVLEARHVGVHDEVLGYPRFAYGFSGLGVRAVIWRRSTTAVYEFGFVS